LGSCGEKTQPEAGRFLDNSLQLSLKAIVSLSAPAKMAAQVKITRLDRSTPQTQAQKEAQHQKKRRTLSGPCSGPFSFVLLLPRAILFFFLGLDTKRENCLDHPVVCARRTSLEWGEGGRGIALSPFFYRSFCYADTRKQNRQEGDAFNNKTFVLSPKKKREKIGSCLR